MPLHEVGEPWSIVGAERLSPHPIASARLQLISHLAALELLGVNLRVTCYAVVAEAVAVVDDDFAKGYRSEVVSGVTVDVETVVQGRYASAFLRTYESVHYDIFYVGRRKNLSFDNAVVNGNLGICLYERNQARSEAFTLISGVIEIHLADAIGERDRAVHDHYQS